MMTGRTGGLWRAIALLALGGCSDKAGAGQQCVFNDDCIAPLVCAASRCRVQCRSDRDCPSDHLCAPSEAPQKRVCVPRAGEALCAADASCPAGAVCAGNTCWWRCRTDPDCAARSALTCMAAERLCAKPVTAQQQRELPPELFSTPSDLDAPAPADAGTPPGASDASTADAATTDIATTDIATTDITTTDIATTDITTTDIATTDIPVADVVIADTPDVRPATCASDGECFFTNASGRCVAGRCALGTCMTGFADCDGNPLTGCEVSTQSDTRHCGMCGRACNAAPNVASVACIAGACVRSACAPAFGDCNDQPSDGCETDLRTSVVHCGACGAACPNYATPALGGLATTCTAGVCGYTMCQSGRGDCDGDPTNGCEVDLLSSPAHCGACRSPCTAGPDADATCAARRCVRACRAGFGDCDADPATGCERDLEFDPEHCGACGRRCAGTEVCARGACVASAFTAGDVTQVFAPTADTRLTSGIYRFASVRIPAGVTVRTDGPGILQLYARGEIRIEGTIDLSGGNGGNGGIPDPVTCLNGNGSGGATGTGVDGATGNAMTRGAGGTGGTGSEGGVGAGNLPGSGGAFGGGAGGIPTSPGAASGGGGYNGGGGGGGGAGCTFCAAGNGGGWTRGNGGDGSNGNGGGLGGRPTTNMDLYWGADGQNAAFTSGGGGGGGGGSIGVVAAADPAIVMDTFHPGSAGGGGGAPHSVTSGMCNPMNAVGGAGGGGAGGALRLASATAIVVTNSGVIRANGGDGGSGLFAATGTYSGSGGGGSGGAIQFWAPRVSVLGGVSAVGGRGGSNSRATSGGGAGGIGRIAVSVAPTRCALGGSFAPQLTNGCAASTAPMRTAVRAFP